MSYQVVDRIRVDIPDSSDPDRRYHDEMCEVVEILQDDLCGVTDDPRNDYLYRVAF